jgi:hypothetical protein
MSSAILERPGLTKLAPTLPHAHGAWFVIGASTLVGPAVTGRFDAGHLVIAAAGCLGLLAQAAWYGKRRLDKLFAIVFGAGTLGLGLALLLRSASPLLFGSLAACAVLADAHRIFTRGRGRRALVTEMVGMALLSCASAASLAVSGRAADSTTLALIGGNALAFMATVPYVRARVFGVKDEGLWRSMRWAPLVIVGSAAASLTVALGIVGMLALALPAARALHLALVRPRPLRSVSRLGWLEVASSTVYLAVLFGSP